MRSTNKKKQPIEGLGDIVKLVTNSLGFKTCEDCEERRKKLNDMFSFLKITTRELSMEEIYLIEKITDTVPVTDYKIIFQLHNEVFGTRIKPCNCPTIITTLIEKLRYKASYDKLGHHLKNNHNESEV